MLAADWKCLPNSKLNLTWRREAWKMGTEGSAETKSDEGDLVDDRKMPPKDTTDSFMSVFGRWTTTPHHLPGAMEMHRDLLGRQPIWHTGPS